MYSFNRNPEHSTEEKQCILILEELERAKIKHPSFPSDIIHKVSIMNEEAGQSIRAALQLVYENDGNSTRVSQMKVQLRKELIQTAAMCVRILSEDFLK